MPLHCCSVKVKVHILWVLILLSSTARDDQLNREYSSDVESQDKTVYIYIYKNTTFTLSSTRENIWSYLNRIPISHAMNPQTATERSLFWVISRLDRHRHTVLCECLCSLQHFWLLDFRTLDSAPAVLPSLQCTVGSLRTAIAKESLIIL